MGRGTANQRLDWGGSTADVIACEVAMPCRRFPFVAGWLLVVFGRFGATLVPGRRTDRRGGQNPGSGVRTCLVRDGG